MKNGFLFVSALFGLAATLGSFYLMYTLWVAAGLSLWQLVAVYLLQFLAACAAQLFHNLGRG